MVKKITLGKKLEAGSVEIEGSAFDIDGGTIDGTDVTVGSGKTLDVSAGTLTLANDQIYGDKISWRNYWFCNYNSTCRRYKCW